MVVSLLYWFHFVSLQQAEPTQCVIVQDKMSISTPPTPSFLSKNNITECQVNRAVGEMLRCGKSDVYIKPECVCTFHNVYEASKYHNYSSCPQGEKSDVVTQLKCPDCKMYSLNNKGPCINGGNLTCKGNEVAPVITCICPPHYKGMFCEEKMENITRLCDIISNSSAILKNCDVTKEDCVTYSRNRRYAFQCFEAKTSRERGGLPMCIDTEDITMPPAVTDVNYSIVTGDAKTVRAKSLDGLSAAEIHPSIPLLTVISLSLQYCEIFLFRWM